MQQDKFNSFQQTIIWNYLVYVNMTSQTSLSLHSQSYFVVKIRLNLKIQLYFYFFSHNSNITEALSG